MNIRQLRDLAIKFIGLGCLSSGVVMLSQVFMMFDYSWQGEHLASRILPGLSIVLTILLYLVLAGALLFKSRAVAGLLWPAEEEAGAEPSISASLEMGVALVGLYYIPEVLSKVASDLFFFVVRPESASGYHGYTNLLAHAFMLAVALLCIVKAKAIATHIRKYTE